MPIYEYQCEDCGHVFDALQKISEDPLKDCPDCGLSSLRKLVSAPNFRLKGSGWYETDFKDKNKRNLAGDSGKQADAKPAEKSADTKPAASSEAKPSSDKPKAKPVDKSAD